MRNLLFRIWYWYISTVDKNADIIFMNFGYSHPDISPEMSEENEKNRYPAQLYYKTSSVIDLSEKDILEVGCGRGGGLSFVTDSLNPKSAIGIDLNRKAIKFCNKFYKNDKLSFVQADAQDLPFIDNSFDFILNVESSHRYPDMPKFLSEVKRVLRPGGVFSITDFRYDHEMEELKEQLKDSEMAIQHNELITKNVTDALRKMTKDRKALVKRFLPGFLHKTGYNFAGVEGTETFNFFDTGKYEYFHYILKNN